MSGTDKPPRPRDATPASSVRHVTIDARHAGQRLDNFLLNVFRGAPRSLIYRILRKGEVRVNKGRATAKQRLVAGDVVRLPPVRLDATADAGKPPEERIQRLKACVLHEDDCLLVLNKPAGLAVHRGSGVNWGVIDLLRASRGEAQMLELVHRLDRDTSGCLLLAKSREALLALQAQMGANGEAEKRYWAVVHGHFDRRITGKTPLRVEAPLQKNQLQGGERMVRVDRGGKPASTTFRRLHCRERASLIEARLHTGRTHQVRVHAAYVGHPIVGDDKYGDTALNKSLRQSGPRFKGMALHAASLVIRHPISDTEQRFDAPLPETWRALLAYLDLPWPKTST